MTEKDPITPKGYVQEFIEVLKAEIEELKQSKDNNIILMNGILFESKNGYNIYQFDTKQPFSPQDNVVYKIVTSSAQFDCEYVSSDNCQVLLKTFRPPIFEPRNKTLSRPYRSA